MPTQTGKEMSVSSGVSTSVCSLSFRHSIYQCFNISYKGMWLCWSCLSVCQCWVLLCTHGVCVCVSVAGVGSGREIIYGETTQLCHHSNIWASASTSHCKNPDCQNQGISHSNLLSHTHTPHIFPFAHVMMKILLKWLTTLLFFFGFGISLCRD